MQLCSRKGTQNNITISFLIFHKLWQEDNTLLQWGSCTVHWLTHFRLPLHPKIVSVLYFKSATRHIAILPIGKSILWLEQSTKRPEKSLVHNYNEG